MSRLIMCKGLPGSGKSTWARSIVRDSTDVKRVNKDDLRTMLNDGVWSKKNEKTVVATQEALIRLYLSQGYSVIVDNTNFGWDDRMRALAEEFGVEFRIQDFTDVPVETCIKNDLNRRASVGKDVIMRMYNQYLAPAPEEYVFQVGLPSAIIVDIDGTLAHMTGRSPYEWHRVNEDALDEVVAGLVRNEIRNGRKIIIVSGRDGGCRDVTEAWLKAKGVHYDALFMRGAGDMRKDSIVKREIFDAHIRNQYNVLYVLDDRNQVVDEWRRMGLKCLQVAPGDF